MIPSNATVIRNACDDFAKGDIPAVIEAFDASLTWHVPGHSPLSRDSRATTRLSDFSNADGTFRWHLQHRGSSCPIKQPTKFELVINLKTSKSPGPNVRTWVYRSSGAILESHHFRNGVVQPFGLPFPPSPFDDGSATLDIAQLPQPLAQDLRASARIPTKKYADSRQAGCLLRHGGEGSHRNSPASRANECASINHDIDGDLGAARESANVYGGGILRHRNRLAGPSGDRFG